jgi:hypothetical protein
MVMKVANQILYLFTRGDAEPLALRTGDLVSALVRDAAQEEVVLLLNGRQIRARSSAVLKPGERVHLVLQEKTGDGRLIFRIAGKHISSQFRDGDIQSLLRNWGIPEGEANILLARELHARGVAVTREEFLLLSGFLPARELSPELVKSLVHLWSRGLPLGPSQLHALAAFLRAPEEGLPDPFQLLAFLGENAFQAGKEILLSSQESREWLMAKLMGLKRNLGLDYEAQLRENVQEGGRRDFSPSPSLKSLLLSLTGDKAGREFPFFQARTLLQALTGLQLLHVYAPSEKGASLHLLGWLSLPERVAPFYLSFGESGDQEEKAGRIIQRQVYIHTVTPKLGRILTELRLVESYLSCMVTVEKEETREFIDSRRERLQNLLQDLPWPVIIFPCRLAGPRAIQENWLNHLCGIEREGKLDLRV